MSSRGHQHHQRLPSPGTVPFSWENQPGVSKISPEPGGAAMQKAGVPKLKLRPPPCPDAQRITSPGIYVPLPPCPFQPPPGKYALLRKEDDPFLVAYINCTKSGKGRSRGGGGGCSWKDGFGMLSSCKSVCGSVRDDAMVRLSQVPVSHGSRRRRRRTMMMMSLSSRDDGVEGFGH